MMYVASAKSRSVRGAFHQLAFIDSCLTISHTRWPVYLVDELVQDALVPLFIGLNSGSGGFLRMVWF